MSDLIRCCVDRLHGAGGLDYAAMPTQYRWPNGSALKVRLLNGPASIRDRITALARTWSDHANVTFDFGDHADAAIRVAIRDGEAFTDPGSWSYLGTYALNIPDPEPTMNFGWLTEETSDTEYSRVVLHEFGHALGLIHEHQNPTANIPWDREKVYAYYMGPPNNWSKEEVDHNLFALYSRSVTQFSEFDRDSIMLYPIPKAFTTNNFEVGWNTALSLTDIDFIRQMYPPPMGCTDMLPEGAPEDYAALVEAKKWPNGTTLTVRFLDGRPEVQSKVIGYARQWSQYANIRFDFGNHANAVIRISFSQPGSWSYLGTDARDIPAGAPTMNYGWLTPQSKESEYSRVVLHEFGHALGLIHEHQNPTANIPWDKPKVYEHYRRSNGWDKAKVDHNLFKTYSRSITQFTRFDRDSIMLYPVPRELTTGGFEVGWNTVLSPTDIAFIRRMYPRA